MGRTIDAHLTGNEIGWLLASQASAASMPSPAPVDSGAVQQHLTGCPECRQKLQLHESFMRCLRAVEVSKVHPRTPQCPPDEVWMQLATGQSAQEASDGLLAHAAQCGYCGALLREATEDLAGDLKPEEVEMIAALPSAQRDGQKRLAAELSQASRVARRPIPLERPAARAGSRMRWVYASAAALVLGVAAWMFFVWQHATSPAQLLASAYSQLRTLELRIPLARFGPMRLERGGPAGGSRMNTPPALSEADATIARRLNANPDDPEWLALKARADLLDWNYGSAIRAANRALEQRPDSIPVLIDLATAYFERAEKEQRPVDYGTAAELLGKVLAKSPDEAVALFNRAIAYEKLSAYHEALADWERYLKLDAHGDWAEEARRRRDAVAKLLREHDGRSQPLTDASEFLEQETRHPEIAAAQDEFYLETAVKKWLPEAFSPPGVPPATKTRAALVTLSKALVAGHEDHWLEDVLATTSSPAFATATASLARAVAADAGGEFAQGQEEAAKAEHWFEKAGSAAGLFRAKLERIYALDRSGQGQRCLDATEALVPQLAGRRYSWLRVQLQLELAGCAGSVGRQGMQCRALQQALLLTGPSRYRALQLRTLSYAAQIESYKGNRPKTWALDVEGLKLFWAASYPSMPAYNFYAELAISAENAGQWNLAVAMNREAVRALSSSRNQTVEAIARFELGKAAMMAGALTEARDALDSADRLIGRLPDGPAFEFYRAECQIGLAKVALRDGRTQHALLRLKQARERLAHTQNYFMISNYFGVLSEADERSGQNVGAESATRSEVAVAELALASLRGGRERQIWNREMAAGYYRLVETEWRLHKDPQGALEIWEWYRGAALRAGSAGTGSLDLVSLEAHPPLPSLSEARELTGALAGQTVLSYAVLPHGLAIWVADNRGISSQWVHVSADELRLLVSRFRAFCSDPGSDVAKLRAASRQLYDLLILPVTAQLSRDRLLLVELDPALSPIPMQALVDVNGEYLGTKFAITVFPGISYLRRLRTVRPITSGARALVVGTPALSGEGASSFQPLPEAADEARGVASKFKNARLLSGQFASAAAVERELPGVAVFHYAGHSISNADRVGLLLAGNGSRVDGSAVEGGESVLEASSFDNSRVGSCALAVFSACATEGVESDGAGDPESLVRVFLEAGVPQVMASRWNVDSRTTAEFMKAFYSRLLEGQPAATAARAAAAEIRAQPDKNHPYYWAAFSVYGRG